MKMGNFLFAITEPSPNVEPSEPESNYDSTLNDTQLDTSMDGEEDLIRDVHDCDDPGKKLKHLICTAKM